MRIKILESDSRLILELILPAVFLILFSTVYLWRIKSEIKYPLFIFAFLLSYLFYICLKVSKIVVIKISIKLSGITLNILDFLPLILTLFLIGFTVAQFETIVSFVISIFVVLFVPGYAILCILCFKPRYTVLEIVVLSLGLSIPISSLIFTGVIWFETAIRQLLIYCFLLLSGLSIAMSKRRKSVLFDNENIPQRVSISLTISESLLWGLIISFFTFSIYTLYPNITHSDIITNYSSSLMLSKGTTYGFPLSWFIFLETILLILAPQPIEIFQTGLVFLNIVLIFSYYILAKAYLYKLDKRAPIISTVIWCTFSGFGWISLWVYGSSGYANVFLDLWVGQTPWLWLWYRGISLGFILLFIMMYMLTRQDIHKTTYIFLMVLFGVGLTLTHFSEIILFTFLIFGLAILRSILCLELRLKDTALALTLAFGIVILLTGFYTQVFEFAELMPSFIRSLFILSIFLYIALKLGVDDIIIKAFKVGLRFTLIKVSRFLPIIPLIFWLALLFEWGINHSAYSNIVNEIWAVPWGMYPVLLGVSGLITVIGIVTIKDRYAENYYVMFIVIALLGIVFGRLISYVNLNITWVQYVERRIVPFTFSAISIPSGAVLIKSFRKLRQVNTFNRISIKYFISLFLISLLVISGFSSTAIIIERQYLTKSNSYLESDETKAIEFLNSYKDYYAKLITYTSHPVITTEYIPTLWKPYTAFEIFWAAKSPEFVLNALADGNDTLFFLHTKDMDKISNSYQSNYLSFLTEFGTLLFNNTKVKIIELTSLFPPVLEGNIALVLPQESELPAYYIHTLLSLSRVNYTSALVKDIKTIQKYSIIVVPNEDTALKLLDYREIYGLEFQTLVVFNFDGYGRLAAELFDQANLIESIKLDELDEGGKYQGVAWTPGGDIGILSLCIDLEEKVSGENGLAIEVVTGNYTNWEIIRDIQKGLDVSKFSFISFYWYGKGDNTTYTLQMVESDENKVLYEFKDEWIGWRKIFLPMWILDGTWELYGVQFTKDTKKVTPWTNIRKIILSSSHGEKSKSGTFHIAGFSFLMPNFEENVPFVVRRAYENFELYYYDILRLTKNFKDPTSSLMLLDSLSAISNDNFQLHHTTSEDLTRNLIAFKEGIFTGEVYLKGTSIILYCSNSITINELPTKCPQDSSAIIPLNFTEFHAIAKHVNVENGQGYYTNILAEDVTVVFKGSPARISIGFGSKQELEFKGSEIRIVSDYLGLQIRNAKIFVSGSGELKQFYGYGDLQVPRKFGGLTFYGQDFIFSGVLNCSVSFGDAFTIVEQFRLQGAFYRLQPLYNFDENAAILRSAVFLIPLITLSVFLKRKKQW